MTDFAPDRVDDVPSHAKLACGEVVGRDTDDRYPTAANGHCGTSATTIAVAADPDARDVAFCARHLPSLFDEPTATLERSKPDDPFDRTPDDYDVSDHPAYQG